MATVVNETVQENWLTYLPSAAERQGIQRVDLYFRLWHKLRKLKIKLDADLRPSFLQRFFLCCDRYRYRKLSQSQFDSYHKAIWDALEEDIVTFDHKERCEKTLVSTGWEMLNILTFILDEGLQYPGLRTFVEKLDNRQRFQLWATLRGLHTVKAHKMQQQYFCHCKCFRMNSQDINLLKANITNITEVELGFYVPPNIDFDTLNAWIRHIALKCPMFVEALKFEKILTDVEWNYLLYRLNQKNGVLFFRQKNTIFVGWWDGNLKPAEITYKVRQAIDGIMLKHNYPTTEFDCSLLKKFEDCGKLIDRLALHDPYSRLRAKTFSDLNTQTEEDIKAYYGLQMWAFWVFNQKIRTFFRNVAIYSFILIWFWEWRKDYTWRQKMAQPAAILYCTAVILNTLYFAFIDVPRIADNLQMRNVRPKSLGELTASATKSVKLALSNFDWARNVVHKCVDSFHVGRFICNLVTVFFLAGEVFLLIISINFQGFTTNLAFKEKPEYLPWFLYMPMMVKIGKSVYEAWPKDLPGGWAALIHVTVFLLLSETHAIVADILVRKLGDYNSRKEEEASLMGKRFQVEVVETHILTLFILYLAGHEGYEGITLLEAELSSIFMIDQVRKLMLETARPLFEQWCSIWITNLVRFCKRSSMDGKFPTSKEAFLVGINKEFTLQETEWFDQFFEPLNMVGYLQFAYAYPIAGPVSWIMQVIEDRHDSFRIRKLERRVCGTKGCHMEVWEKWLQKIAWVGFAAMLYTINIALVDNWYVPCLSVLGAGFFFNQFRSTNLWKDLARFSAAKIDKADDQAEKLWEKTLDSLELICDCLNKLLCCFRKTSPEVKSTESVAPRLS